MAFWWTPCIPVGNQRFFGSHVMIWWPPGILVGTQCLFSWAHGFLVASWHLGVNVVLILVAT